MTQLIDIIGLWPVEWVISGLLALIILIFVVGLFLERFTSMGGLFKSIKLTQSEIEQLKCKDTADNLKQFKERATIEKMGILSNYFQRAFLIDEKFQPVALTDPFADQSAKKVIDNMTNRIWSWLVISLLTFLAVSGTIIAVINQLADNQMIETGQIILFVGISLLLILIYKLLDIIIINLAIRRIQKIRRALSSILPVVNEAKLQYQILIGQQANSNALKTLGTELNTAISESIQKQLLPLICNLNQSIEQAIMNLNEQQVNGIAKMAAHFARQLEQSFGDNMGTLTNSIQSMNTLYESSSLRASNLIAHLDRSTDIQAQTHDMTRQVMASLADARQIVTSSSEQLREVLVQTADVAHELQGIIKTNQAQAAQLKHEQATIGEQINVYFDQMNKKNTEMQDDLHANLSEIFSRFTDLYQTSQSQAMEQNQQMLTQLSDQSSQLISTMEEQVREMSFQARDINLEIAGLTKSLDSSVQLLGEQLNNNTQAAFKEFDHGLADIVGHLSKTIDMIRDAVDDLPAAVVSVRQLITEQALKDPDAAHRSEE